MTPECFLEWMKALGVPLLAVVVSATVAVFSWWQVRIAREKLRRDLYDRRFAIYMAFHEMLVAFADKPYAYDFDPEMRKANAARAHSPLLLDMQLGNYLKGLHDEAFKLNTDRVLVSNPSMWTSPIEQGQKQAQLATGKLTFADKVPELVQEFEHFLKLDDFSKHKRKKRRVACSSSVLA
jgi:hypothetical protein